MTSVDNIQIARYRIRDRNTWWRSKATRMVTVNNQIVSIVSVRYEEPYPESYEGVSLSVRAIGNDEYHRWNINTGNPERDLLATCLLSEMCNFYTMFSSSVDCFVIDGGDLGSMTP